jgi:hypothetical protein
MRQALAKLGRWPWTLAALFAFIALGRALFVATYAEAIPFWDQWDAEGWKLLKPWAEGRLHFSDLVATHNEHRIALTRLISIALFEANSQQWDNLLLALFNTLIYAGVATLVFALLSREGSRVARIVLFAASLAFALFPFAWENTLVGFQNQFYLMNGFAVAAVAISSFGKEGRRTEVLILAMCLLSLFTMASGLLAAVAAGAVLVARTWTQSSSMRMGTLATVALLAATAIGAYLMVPDLPQHASLKAPDAHAWLKAFATAAGWPLGYWGCVIIWFPSLLFLLRVLVSRKSTPSAMFAAGMAFWALLQCAAIAYSRGGTPFLSPRYLDSLAIGALANLALALGFLGDIRKAKSDYLPVAALAAPLIVAALGLGLMRSLPGDMAQTRNRLELSRIQTERVADFMSDGDRTHLQAPALHIPYPDAATLEGFLQDPVMRKILPSSIKAPLPLVQEHATRAAGTWHDATDTGQGIVSCGVAQCESGFGDWQSQQLRSAFPYVALQTFVGGVAPQELELEVIGNGEKTLLHPRPGSQLHVTDVDRHFKIALSDHSQRGWIMLRDVREVGRLSSLAIKAQRMARRWFAGAVANPAMFDRWTDLPSAPTDNVPIAFAAGQKVEGTFELPHDGLLSGMSVLIGTYGGQSRGAVDLTRCLKGNCKTYTASLDEAVDNGPLCFFFSEPLWVKRGEVLRFTIESKASVHPVGLWAYPRIAESPSVTGAIWPADRSLRMRVAYQN